jgi:hypothetical protein
LQVLENLIGLSVYCRHEAARDSPKAVAMVPMWSPEKPTERLTQRAVHALSLPEGEQDRTCWDSDIAGFGVRLRGGGSKTFVFWYRIGTRRRKMALGSATAITVAEARRRAGILHAEVKLGRDPAGEKEQSKARADETFGALLPRYLARQRERLRERAYVEVERHARTATSPPTANQHHTPRYCGDAFRAGRG